MVPCHAMVRSTLSWSGLLWFSMFGVCVVCVCCSCVFAVVCLRLLFFWLCLWLCVMIVCCGCVFVGVCLFVSVCCGRVLWLRCGCVAGRLLLRPGRRSTAGYHPRP